MAGLKQAFYYATGIVMMKGISLIMLPYLTHKLTLADYGILESLILIADIGTIVFSFGIVEAMYRYVGGAEGKQRQRLISNCFTLSVIVSVIGGTLLLVTAPLLSALLSANFTTWQLVLVLIPTLLDGVISIPLTLLRMNQMAKRFCLLNVTKALVHAFITFALIELGFGINGVLIASAITSVGLTLALLRFQYQQMGRFGELLFSRQLLSFGLPVLIGGVSLYAVQGLDKWFVTHYLGVETLAQYAVATKFSLILALLIQPYALWWFPTRIQMLQQSDGPTKCAQQAIIGVNFGIMAASLMALSIPTLVNLLLPEQYQNVSIIALALLAITVVKNAGDYMNLGCFSGQSTQAQMWVQCGCAIAAVLGYVVMTPHYGLNGILSILGGAYALRLTLLYVISQSKVKLPYQHRHWFTCLLLSVAMLGFNFLLSQLLHLELASVAEIAIITLSSVTLVSLYFLLGFIPVPPRILSAIQSRRALWH
ncbi:oligosaccharide flippase family protein [Vibrio sp. SM6]|uniref:Oligosaccharide flippase family protein n=1 Tax=Vibrio agarilyticus TaxID=2726741 RepID=A0A7X8TRS1_9VIBR|nr:oligosaccharide flippase family protein [Vibrio agarilyticus]NLS13441.1 oligosaccharide flippase family protein [Vibrio agarilyticus]